MPSRIRFIEDWVAHDLAVYASAEWSERQATPDDGDVVECCNSMLTRVPMPPSSDRAPSRSSSRARAFSDGNPLMDHNMSVHRNRLYPSNDASGLWIHDTRLAGQGRLDQRGFFDVSPIDDRADFFGSRCREVPVAPTD